MPTGGILSWRSCSTGYVSWISWLVGRDKGGKMDNYTLTMLGLTVFILLFGLAVERLTREDRKHKGQSK
jgi:hypothetical protein